MCVCLVCDVFEIPKINISLVQSKPRHTHMTIQLFQPIEIYSGVVKFNAIKMKRNRTERCKNFQYKNSGTIVFNLPALNWFSRSNDYFILVNERAILLTNCIYRHEIDWLTGKFHWMKCIRWEWFVCIGFANQRPQDNTKNGMFIHQHNKRSILWKEPMAMFSPSINLYIYSHSYIYKNINIYR